MPGRQLILSLLLVLVSTTAHAQDLVAPTGPLTPAEQQKKFKLPPGFAIELVACEPDIHKPMNLAFDARGRLWVTHSLEYPFAAKDDAAARDAITIFSDFDASGRARKVHRIAEKLNIPIGVLPLTDGEALAWSIPHIFRLKDADGDGRVESRQVAFGPFGIADTHGNQNAFTRWIDGWVYACHGFSNHSQVKIGGEGDVVLEMQSGNTYRFRADGSAIEQHSFGQVNPFGLAFDPLGNIFTADCHSRPVTMVLRGGYYQSFGKPHDGLGFAPETTTVDHGGTGISGIVYYAAEHFPAKYRDVLFVGNVITNRIHIDRIEWHGSSPVVKDVSDFLTCDDPWFRPVDIQLGPDGALYVADFYNKIIGHYEVPLTHPERDRERGRIWRIVYTGEGVDNEQVKRDAMPDLREAPADRLAELLGHTNLTIRILATNALVDRFPNQGAAQATKLLETSQNDAQRAHALWVVQRLAGIDESRARSLAEDKSRLVRTHLAQAMGETTSWQAWHYEIVRSALDDADPFVRRAAAEALGKHPAAENVPVLVRALSKVDQEDAQLRHALRISLRNQLRDARVGPELARLDLPAEQRRHVLEIASISPSGPAATLIYEAALRGEVGDDLLARALPSAARYVDAAKVDGMLDMIAQRFANDAGFRLTLLRGIHEGLAERGRAPSDRLRKELTELVAARLSSDPDLAWINRPVPGAAPSASPWGIEERDCSDGQRGVRVISSLPTHGPATERLTGILRSPKFTIPERFSFWMCGHNGLPGSSDEQKNYVRLVLEDGTEVARSYPPRNDVAHPYTWELKEHAGRKGYLEVVDGFVADGWAWLAVTRFEPEVVRLPEGSVGDPNASRAEMLRLAGDLKLAGLREPVAQVAKDGSEPMLVRLAACQALVQLAPVEAVAPLGEIIARAETPTVERQVAAALLGQIDRDDARAALVAQLKTAPQPVATVIAAALAARRETAQQLLDEIRAGRASAALLREPTVVARLEGAGVEKLKEQIDELTARLTPADDRIAQLIQERRERFLAGSFDASAGEAIFARSECAKCHRIGQTGATIAPALDGIGNRGLDRLLEDILDPSRNVDAAFRVQTIVTSGGQIHSGFGAREEGKTLVMYDSAGKEVRVALDEIDERSVSPLSPMPANLAEQIPEQDFYPLLAWLLSQKAK